MHSKNPVDALKGKQLQKPGVDYSALRYNAVCLKKEAYHKKHIQMCFSRGGDKPDQYLISIHSNSLITNNFVMNINFVYHASIQPKPHFDFSI